MTFIWRGDQRPRRDIHKILIDTCNSFDLMFNETLKKMGIDLQDMKSLAWSLTGFSGFSKEMLGTIRLNVFVEEITKIVKFSVIGTPASYNMILGTPWIHSMRAVPSTYYQCIKFININVMILTLKGDQNNDRNLLIS